MAETKKNTDKYKIINFKRVSDKSGIPYQKIYDNLVLKRYKTLDLNDKTLMCNAIVEEISPILNELGFKVTISRISKL